MTMSNKFLLAALVNAVVLLAMVDASKSSSIRRGSVMRVEDLANMNTAELLRNAIKVDNVHTRKRILEEGEQGEEEQGEDQEGQEDNAENEGEEEAQEDEQQGGEEEDNAEEEDQGEEGDQAEEDSQDEGEEGDAEEEEDVEEEEEEDPLLQLNFLKCGAFTIQPNDDEEVTEYLSTQESIVFFTVGYGDDDYERSLYMTTLENWVRASMGYEDVCHQLDEGDVNTIFSTIGDETFVEKYAEHAWYSGFNCLEDGTGFGSQLFLNEECTTYAPTMSNYYPFPEGTEFEAAADEADAEEDNASEEEENANVDYSNRVASDMTPYMIQNADYFLENVHYCEKKEGGEGEEGDENQEQAQNDIEFCENLFGVSVDVVTCNLYGEEGDENQEQEEQQQECDCAEEEQAAEGEEEQGEENAEENADEGGEGERKKRRRNQECNCAQQDNGYQINYEEIGDVEASCATVRSILAIDQYSYNGMNAEYVVSMWNNVKDGHQPSSSQTSSKGWIVALVCAAVVAVIVMAACCCMRPGQKKTESETTRSEPLMSSANKPARKKKESIEIYFQGSKRQDGTAGGSDC